MLAERCEDVKRTVVKLPPEALTALQDVLILGGGSLIRGPRLHGVLEG